MVPVSRWPREVLSITCAAREAALTITMYEGGRTSIMGKIFSTDPDSTILWLSTPAKPLVNPGPAIDPAFCASALERLIGPVEGTLGLPPIEPHEKFLVMVRELHTLSPGSCFEQPGLTILMDLAGRLRLEENLGILAVHRNGEWRFPMPGRGQSSVIHPGDWLQIDGQAFQMPEPLILRHLERDEHGAPGAYQEERGASADCYPTAAEQRNARLTERLERIAPREIELEVPLDGPGLAIGRRGRGDFSSSSVSGNHLFLAHASDRQLKVMDVSRNGTELFSSDGYWHALPHHQWMTVPAATIFRLGGAAGEIVRFKVAQLSVC